MVEQSRKKHSIKYIQDYEFAEAPKMASKQVPLVRHGYGELVSTICLQSQVRKSVRYNSNYF